MHYGILRAAKIHCMCPPDTGKKQQTKKTGGCFSLSTLIGTDVFMRYDVFGLEMKTLEDPAHELEHRKTQ